MPAIIGNHLKPEHFTDDFFKQLPPFLHSAASLYMMEQFNRSFESKISAQNRAQSLTLTASFMSVGALIGAGVTGLIASDYLTLNRPEGRMKKQEWAIQKADQKCADLAKAAIADEDRFVTKSNNLSHRLDVSPLDLRADIAECREELVQNFMAHPVPFTEHAIGFSTAFALTASFAIVAGKTAIKSFQASRECRLASTALAKWADIIRRTPDYQND